MADTIGIERIHNRKSPNFKPYRRGKIAEFLSHIAKFAFESTLVESLSISTGRKREESKDQPFPLPFDDKNEPRDLKLVREEMRAKMEKVQENMNKIKHCNKISANCVAELEALKKISDEKLQASIEKMQEDVNDVKQQCKILVKGVEESDLPKKKPEDKKGWDLVQRDRKRVFIRSRL
ncbi:uncharacterized protein LOC21393484 [Morus notabilis]|uniref:uncharacterized protein LOC21393484 n=1 Tax=Morus notabilis TaxID=981085 RepID=UPI000CED43A2|nr:uncharacterized protein LOC21393484 [Morus notabilis]